MTAEFCEYDHTELGIRPAVVLAMENDASPANRRVCVISMIWDAARFYWRGHANNPDH